MMTHRRPSRPRRQPSDNSTQVLDWPVRQSHVPIDPERARSLKHIHTVITEYQISAIVNLTRCALRQIEFRVYESHRSCVVDECN